MIPKLTDDSVSLLPLESGRAELLEEIMSTVTPDRTLDEPTPVPSRNRGRWLAPVAAAAVVAGIVAGSLWASGLLPDEDTSVATQPGAQAGKRPVLDAPGWEVTSTESGDDGYGEVNYEKGPGPVHDHLVPGRLVRVVRRRPRAHRRPARPG